MDIANTTTGDLGGAGWAYIPHPSGSDGDLVIDDQVPEDDRAAVAEHARAVIGHTPRRIIPLRYAAVFGLGAVLEVAGFHPPHC